RAVGKLTYVVISSLPIINLKDERIACFMRGVCSSTVKNLRAERGPTATGTAGGRSSSGSGATAQRAPAAAAWLHQSSDRAHHATRPAPQAAPQPDWTSSGLAG